LLSKSNLLTFYAVLPLLTFHVKRGSNLGRIFVINRDTFCTMFLLLLSKSNPLTFYAVLPLLTFHVKRGSNLGRISVINLGNILYNVPAFSSFFK
jgi:hypothetical protein